MIKASLLFLSALFFCSCPVTTKATDTLEDDPELQEALTQSLSEHMPVNLPDDDEEEAQLAQAIAQSLQDQEQQNSPTTSAALLRAQQDQEYEKSLLYDKIKRKASTLTQLNQDIEKRSTEINLTRLPLQEQRAALESTLENTQARFARFPENLRIKNEVEALTQNIADLKVKEALLLSTHDQEISQLYAQKIELEDALTRLEKKLIAFP